MPGTRQNTFSSIASQSKQDGKEWKRAVENTIFRQYTAHEKQPKYTVYDIFTEEAPAPEKTSFEPGQEDDFENFLTGELPENSYRIIFFENLSEDGLMVIGRHYGIGPNDLWKATRRINLPEINCDKAWQWKFLELWTIWTADKARVGAFDKSLSQRIWRARQIGIFFAKVRSSWVFLVLIAPLSISYDYEVSTEEEFNFCYRDPKLSKTEPYSWIATEAPLRDVVDFIARELQEKGPQFLAHTLIDVLWGWERYSAQVKNDIRGIMIKSRLWHEVLDLAVCWRFFKYKLVLNDTINKLTRDLKYLVESEKGKQQAALDWDLPIQFDNVLNRGTHVMEELKSLEGPLSEIASMAYNFTSIKEAQFASHSSHNMEYLAIMAAIFLPLSLFTAAFGLNIRQLTSIGPEWWVVVVISIPCTIIFSALVYYGRAYWTPSRRNRWSSKIHALTRHLSDSKNIDPSLNC